MSKSFDFNTIKPITMTVTLSDEEKTTLLVMTPDKKLMGELMAFRNIQDNVNDDGTLDALYELTGKLLSRNKNGITITAKKLKSLYPDITYIVAFLRAYTDFVKEVIDSKN